MILSQETVWLIMTKDRKMVAKGTPRSRTLVDVDNKTDKKRFLTYSTKGRAEAGFKTYWFFGGYGLTADDYEAVEIKMTMEIL